MTHTHVSNTGYELINGGLGWFGVTDGRLPPLESSSECDSNVDSEVSSHSLHYQTGWLLYLLLRIFPGCITFHRLSIYVVLVFFIPREMMLEEYLMRKKDKKKKEFEIKIHSHLLFVFHPCVYCLTLYIIFHDTRLVWHSCLWDIDIELSFGSFDEKEKGA